MVALLKLHKINIVVCCNAVAFHIVIIKGHFISNRDESGTKAAVVSFRVLTVADSLMAGLMYHFVCYMIHTVFHLQNDPLCSE